MSRFEAPRWYALGVGLLLSLLIAAATPYNEMMIKGSRLGLSSLTPAAFFLFFIWVLAVNPLLKVFWPVRALGRGELLLVFAMMMVATAIPTRGVTGVLLSMISGTAYYAASGEAVVDCAGGSGVEAFLRRGSQRGGRRLGRVVSAIDGLGHSVCRAVGGGAVFDGADAAAVG